MNKRSVLEDLIKKHQSAIGPVIADLRASNLTWLDFTENNTALGQVDLKDTRAFDQWLFEEVLRGKVGIGGFMEDRIVYRRSTHYDGEQARSVHLGIDLWTHAGTPVYAPWSAIVHSFQDNRGFGNYGPTVILAHTLEGQRFYTLYGHLSRSSLKFFTVGQTVKKGEKIAEIGPYPENGDWPPHLHFQVMTDLQGWVGDFPGVVAPSQQAFYATICLNPQYLLRIT